MNRKSSSRGRAAAPGEQPRNPRRARPRVLVLFLAWAGGGLFVASLAYYCYAYLVRFGRPAPDGAVVAPLLGNLALFTAFALHHSAFARMGLKRWIARAATPAAERSVYTWIASALFLLLCRFWQPVPGEPYRLDGWMALPGYLLQIAGILLTAKASAAIDVLDLAGVRQVLDARVGRSSAHAPLETRGVYRLVRHPVYLGWALFVFGAPHMTATRLVFAIISTGYLALAVPWEERSLVTVFGDEYRAYQQRVRWRILPGIY